MYNIHKQNKQNNVLKKKKLRERKNWIFSLYKISYVWCQTLNSIWSLRGSICFLLLGKSLRTWNEIFQSIGENGAYIFHWKAIQEKVSMRESCTHMSERSGSSKWWELMNKWLAVSYRTARRLRIRIWIQWKLVINRTIMEEEKCLFYIFWVNPLDCLCNLCPYEISSYSYYMTNKSKYWIDLAIFPCWQIIRLEFKHREYNGWGCTVIQHAICITWTISTP